MALICFLLSVAVLGFTIVRIVFRRRVPKVEESGSLLRHLTLGVFCSALLLFLPVYEEVFLHDIGSVFKTLFISAHNVLRLFVLDGEFDIMREFTSELDPILGTAYSLYASVIYLFAPLLTFGFVLSLFEDLTSRLRLLINFGADVYVFSSLSDPAVTLAESIYAENRRAMIIFTDVFEQYEEQSFELMCRVRRLRAVVFKRDLLAVNLHHHGKQSSMSFFILGPDEAENISQAMAILRDYAERDNTRLYLFSDSKQSEMLLSTTPAGKIKVRRVDESGALIDQYLYRNGAEIFEHALEKEDGTKLITAVLIGMDACGIRMMRSLSWFCQMDGYKLCIHGFDADPQARSRFTALCPELMSPELNGKDVEGEAFYDIQIHSGISFDTIEFERRIEELTDTSFVFVSLGDDGRNVSMAVRLRAQFERMHIRPQIKAIVRSSQSKRVLSEARNYRGQAYDIDFLGDVSSLYNLQSILNSELEQKALARHMKWGAEEDFWKYEYNYRSSTAAAIHLQMRIACGIPGADKPGAEQTQEERDALEMLEHKRWNAYMRSEGYSYSGSRDKTSRNDLAKLHHDLVPFAMLTEDDKRKDSSVGSK